MRPVRRRLGRAVVALLVVGAAAASACASLVGVGDIVVADGGLARDATMEDAVRGEAAIVDATLERESSAPDSKDSARDDGPRDAPADARKPPPPCSSKTCPTGCCDSRGECVKGDVTPACGTDGAACVYCPAESACNPETHACGQSCEGGLTCAGGCCDGKNCQSGTVSTACGVGASTCASCLATSTICQDYACVSNACASADGGCNDCCAARYPMGEKAYNGALFQCVCAAPSPCATTCAGSFCVDAGPVLTSSPCGMCLESSAFVTYCNASPALGTCFTDPSCVFFSNCVGSCP